MKNRCKDCEYEKVIQAQDGYKFIGCFKKPYQGKPVSEIENCPMGRKREYKIP